MFIPLWFLIPLLIFAFIGFGTFAYFALLGRQRKPYLKAFHDAYSEGFSEGYATGKKDQKLYGR